METKYHSPWVSAEMLEAAGNMEEGLPLRFTVHEESTQLGDIPHSVRRERSVDAVNVLIGPTERVKSGM